VTYAGLLAGRGVVTVTHDGGLRTTYEPVTAEVVVGQQVTTGTVIGFLRDEGHASCRPGTACLHWGLLRGDTYLDPLALITQGRLRLLPLDGTVRPAGLQASTVGRPDPVLPVSPALAHPRRRATAVFVNSAVNLTTVALVGWGLVALVRRGVRLAKRLRG
jgi:murein DD-endopeptidase MepM/ murein hydrolase activator NlpD